MALTTLFRNFKNSFFFCLSKVHYSHTFVQSKSNVIQFSKMNTIYFYNELENDDLHIQLHLLLKNEFFKINKTFNFQRRMSETVDCFLRRLNEKISNISKSKISKTNKKSCTESIEESVLTDINSVFLINNEQVPGETIFKNMFSQTDEKNIKLKILSQYFDVLINCPSITELSLPKNVYVGCPVFPEKLKTKCAKKSDCQFTWFKGKNNKSWVQCGEGFFYCPTAEDLDHFLKIKCLPKNGAKEGLLVETNSLSTVQESENFFLIRKRHEFTNSKTTKEEFRVITYNLLANVYATTKEATNNLFIYCNPIYMDFKYRKTLITMELIGYNADLICLQEVDKKMFEDHLLPYFECKDFSGTFICKDKEGFREGCAFFSSNEKFEITDTHQHILSEELQENSILSNIKEKVSQNKNLMTRINGLKTQVQVGIFKSLTSSGNIILVGNVHLYFHPDADHIRLLQGIISFKILLHHKQILEEKNPKKKVSIIFCGDFNSTPDCGIYKLVTKGSVTENEIDWKSKLDETITDISFNNPLKMSSAYGAPKYTNYTKDFKECLDYIFFQTDNLELRQVVPLPSEEDLSKETAIPSAYFPSDHIALIADLKWK